MGLQDDRILSPLLAIRVLFLSPLVWGGPFYFVLIFLFFLQSSAANITCTNWRSETNQKKKKVNHNQKKNQKTKTDLKTRQPNSSEAHGSLLLGNQVTPKTKSAGIVGPLAHFIPRRHAHGALHCQEHRTEHTVRS